MAAPWKASYMWKSVWGVLGAVRVIVVVQVSTSDVVSSPVRECIHVRGARARTVLVSPRAFRWCADRHRARSRSRDVDGQHGQYEVDDHLSKKSYITPCKSATHLTGEELTYPTEGPRSEEKDESRVFTTTPLLGEGP